MKKTIIFDLDGTLLPMDGDMFQKVYVQSLTTAVGHIVEPKHMGAVLMTSIAATVASEDASKTNEQVFNEEFERGVGIDAKRAIEAMLDDYYQNEYDIVKTITHIDANAVEAVHYLKSKGYRVILATNPLFPRVATDKRIVWSGLSPEMFADVTRFESCVYAKPNPQYYQALLDKHGLSADACVMIGNDVQEDMVAKTLGIEAWLVDDNIIHRGGDIDCDWRGSRRELLAKIKAEF